MHINRAILSDWLALYICTEALKGYQEMLYVSRTMQSNNDSDADVNRCSNESASGVDAQTPIITQNRSNYCMMSGTLRIRRDIRIIYAQLFALGLRNIIFQSRRSVSQHESH